LEWGIALKGVKKMRKCFWLKKRAGRGRNQTGSLEIQMYASFLAQNAGLQESVITHYLSVQSNSSKILLPGKQPSI
jgi:hypothetical protein